MTKFATLNQAVTRDKSDLAKIPIFKFKMAYGCHIEKYRFWRYLSSRWSNFHRIITRMQDLRVMTVECENFHNLTVIFQ